MNGTVIDGGKVHLLTEKAARCGVGHHARRGQWQMELGEVTCQRCIKLRLVPAPALCRPDAERLGVSQREKGGGNQ